MINVDMKEIRVLYWTDLHAHDWEKNVRPNRWQDFVSAVVRVYGIADDWGANLVVFGGDLFESKVEHKSNVWSSVIGALLTGIQSEQHRENVFLTGNHDIYRGQSVLQVLDTFPNVKVVHPNRVLYSTFPLHEGKYISTAFVPYGWGGQPNAAHPVLALFTHCEFAGMTYGRGIVAKNTTIHNDWLRVSKNIFNGHMHVRQRAVAGKGNGKKTSITCQGPLIPINWVDASDRTQFDRGVLKITLTADSVVTENVPFAVFPRFFNSPTAFRGIHPRAIDFVGTPTASVEAEQEKVTTEVITKRIAKGVKRGEELLVDYVDTVPCPAVNDRELLLTAGRKLYIGD